MVKFCNRKERKDVLKQLINNSFHWKQYASVKCLKPDPRAQCGERCVLPVPCFLWADRLVLGSIRGRSCCCSENRPVAHRQSCNTSEWKGKRHITAVPEHAASEVLIHPIHFRCLAETWKFAALTSSSQWLEMVYHKDLSSCSYYNDLSQVSKDRWDEMKGGQNARRLMSCPICTKVTRWRNVNLGSKCSCQTIAVKDGLLIISNAKSGTHRSRLVRSQWGSGWGTTKGRLLIYFSLNFPDKHGMKNTSGPRGPTNISASAYKSVFMMALCMIWNIGQETRLKF